MISVCKNRIDIRDGLSNKDYYEDTDYELRITGKLYNDKDFMRIAKDELCYSPVMLLNAQKSITIIEKAYQTIEKMSAFKNGKTCFRRWCGL